MKRPSFACLECGATSPKWVGRCPECGSWNSFAERSAPASRPGSPRPSAAPITEVGDGAVGRFDTGLADLDRVLGGGLVPGSLVLLGGEPGIGKSTLLLQAAGQLSRSGRRVLYLCAEESPDQVRARAARLGALDPNLFVLADTDPQSACVESANLSPVVVVVDSVQAVADPGVPSPAGSIGQVRAAALRFQRQAREIGAPVILVGHVTKDGSLAGPKSLEHVVDVVLSFEGDRARGRRILRALKNRFGPVEEVALFEMTRAGLEEIADPSAALLAERRAGVPGSAVSASVEGTRPLLVEIQALVGSTVTGSARRSAVGLDPARLSMILAVLEARAGVAFSQREVFASCAGGFDVREPAVDLAVAAALLSSHRQVPLPAETMFFGEVGLLGEVRSVPDAATRLREAVAHGFRRAYVPRSDLAAASELPDLDARPVSDVRELTAEAL